MKKKKNKGIPRHLLVALSLAVFGSFVGCQKSQNGNGMDTQKVDPKVEQPADWREDMKDEAKDKAQPYQDKNGDDKEKNWWEREDDDQMKGDKDQDADEYMNHHGGCDGNH